MTNFPSLARRLFLAAAIIITISSCSAKIPVSTPTIISPTTAIDPEAAVPLDNPTLINPTEAKTELENEESMCKPEVQRLDELRIKRFWWLSNAAEIGFQTETDETGIYRLQDQKFLLGGVDIPTEVEIPKKLLSGIPEPIEANNVKLAPSGFKAVYLVFTTTVLGESTQDVSDEMKEIGEANISKIYTDVYWLDPSFDGPLQIGSVEGQVWVIWSSDENKVMLISMIPSGPFGPVSVWIYDHTSSILHELFDTLQDDFHPLSFTPDGKKILFQRDREIRTINLDNKEEIVLPLPPFQHFWWKADDQLIALVPSDRQYYKKVILYNLTNNSTQNLSTIEINPILFVSDAVSLSPDQSTVAFIENNDRSLNIVKLCY
jgi:hypothetical protein